MPDKISTRKNEFLSSLILGFEDNYPVERKIQIVSLNHPDSYNWKLLEVNFL